MSNIYCTLTNNYLISKSLKFKRITCSSQNRLRPYRAEHARSRLISEAKQRWAWLVLGWETAWEYQVL